MSQHIFVIRKNLQFGGITPTELQEKIARLKEFDGYYHIAAVGQLIYDGKNI